MVSGGGQGCGGWGIEARTSMVNSDRRLMVSGGVVVSERRSRSLTKGMKLRVLMVGTRQQ